MSRLNTLVKQSGKRLFKQHQIGAVVHACEGQRESKGRVTKRRWETSYGTIYQCRPLGIPWLSKMSSTRKRAFLWGRKGEFKTSSPQTNSPSTNSITVQQASSTIYVRDQKWNSFSRPHKKSFLKKTMKPFVVLTTIDQHSWMTCTNALSESWTRYRNESCMENFTMSMNFFSLEIW